MQNIRGHCSLIQLGVVAENLKLVPITVLPFLTKCLEYPRCSLGLNCIINAIQYAHMYRVVKYFKYKYFKYVFEIHAMYFVFCI